MSDSKTRSSVVFAPETLGWWQKVSTALALLLTISVIVCYMFWTNASASDAKAKAGQEVTERVENIEATIGKSNERSESKFKEVFDKLTAIGPILDRMTAEENKVAALGNEVDSLKSQIRSLEEQLAACCQAKQTSPTAVVAKPKPAAHSTRTRTVARGQSRKGGRGGYVQQGIRGYGGNGQGVEYSSQPCRGVPPGTENPNNYMPGGRGCQGVDCSKRMHAR